MTLQVTDVLGWGDTETPRRTCPMRGVGSLPTRAPISHSQLSPLAPFTSGRIPAPRGAPGSPRKRGRGLG